MLLIIDINFYKKKFKKNNREDNFQKKLMLISYNKYAPVIIFIF